MTTEDEVPWAVAARIREIHQLLKRGEDTKDHGVIGNLDCIYDSLTTVPNILDDPTPPTDALAPQWLPIETAPKDGTTVLVGIAGVKNSVGEAYWWQSEKGYGGWQTWDGSNHQRTVYVDQPTHWMPLPSPPASKAEGEL